MLTPQQIITGYVMSGSAATYYNALEKTIVQSMDLVNTTGAAVNCTVNIVPNGGAAGVSNRIISARSISAGETYVCPEAVGMVIDAGGSINAIGAGVTIIASGVLVT
jgi:hypothetical protein